MPHHNTVFRQITNHLPAGMIDRLVAAHGADRGVRKFSTKSLLLALIFAQLSDARSLRDIEAILHSQDTRRYHSSLPVVHRSTLADAIAVRPTAVFAELFAALIGQATRSVRQNLNEFVRLIDSTTLPLSTLAAAWARFSADSCAAKAHVVFDPDAGCPLYLAVTPARVTDLTAARDMPIDAGASYVFDLGYYEYAWWAALDAASCRIVTRLKTNTPLRVIQTQAPPAHATHILSDRIGFLPQRLCNNRRNPMATKAVREITVRIDTGRVLRLLTNDLDAPAEEIAALYKRRWDIELFFRWMKQMLKLKHFFGVSENAVHLQILVAMITFVLLKLVHAAAGATVSLTQFARLVRATLLHRKRLANISRTPTHGQRPPCQNRNQLCLFET